MVADEFRIVTKIDPPEIVGASECPCVLILLRNFISADFRLRALAVCREYGGPFGAKARLQIGLAVEHITPAKTRFSTGRKVFTKFL